MANKAERVVLASICKVCECLVGPEKVVVMTPKEIKAEQDLNDGNFFISNNVIRKSRYRMISIEPTCGSC